MLTRLAFCLLSLVTLLFLVAAAGVAVEASMIDAPALLTPPLPDTGLTEVLIETIDMPRLGARVPFTAYISPITATVPIRCIWQATERPTLERSISFLPWCRYEPAWDTIGPQTITVTVSNITSTLLATRTVTILPAVAPLVPPKILGIAEGAAPLVSREYGLGVMWGPPTATLPITYTWLATDLPPVVHPASARLDDGARFVWASPGLKAITFTASSIAGSYTGSSRTFVRIPGYLPLMLRY